MAGTNIDPHDVTSAFIAGENLEAKQFFLVEITEEGKVVLAKAKTRAFMLLNNPAEGQAADIVLPLQCKAPAKEELKPGWALAAANGGELVKAAEEKHVIGICTSAVAVPAGALCPFASFPGGITG
jgi:hypothetical protein